ncbi:hypothetical protein TNCV_4133531 [Trichonephila clavipes]|uniref:Uncharacterized protein n=1 Tax=Trichonephila clavipes TaxID=2585209 RepID=A0A8X6S8R4_TRICX|nr:hypothetical protein TNCV_4133531 [Trichonephila clavipes]
MLLRHMSGGQIPGWGRLQLSLSSLQYVDACSQCLVLKLTWGLSTGVLRQTDPLTEISAHSLAQQPMRARAYSAHPSIRDHWALSCISRCPDHVVSLKREPRYLSPQASLLLETKLPVRLINITNELRLVQGETPLRVKGDIEDVSCELKKGEGLKAALLE